MNRDHMSECGGCGGPGQRAFLFHVRHRGTYRRLCTACVLKNHAGSFCPVCFEVYDEPPPPRDRVMCLNCPSISHVSCLGFDVASSYRCPPCSNPNFSFFDLGSLNKKIQDDSGEVAAPEGGRPINKDLAKQLVAAAQLASASMNKAAAVARVEAERRVKEAALARKRAKEALERVSYLASKEKERLKMDSKAMDEKLKIKSEFDKSERVQNQIRAERFQGKGIVSGPHKNGIPIGGNDRPIHRMEGGKESNGLHLVAPFAESSTSAKQSL